MIKVKDTYTLYLLSYNVSSNLAKHDGHLDRCIQSYINHNYEYLLEYIRVDMVAYTMAVPMDR